MDDAASSTAGTEDLLRFENVSLRFDEIGGLGLCLVQNGRR